MTFIRNYIKQLIREQFKEEPPWPLWEKSMKTIVDRIIEQARADVHKIMDEELQAVLLRSREAGEKARKEAVESALKSIIADKMNPKTFKK